MSFAQVVGGVAVVALLGGAGSSYFSSDTIDTTLVGTEVKRYDDSDRYLIFTPNGTFENTDAWYRGKFRSSDIQAAAMELVGKPVTIEKYGWRLGILSWYENVVDIHKR